MAKKKKSDSKRTTVVEIGNDWLKIAVFSRGSKGLSLTGLSLERIDGSDSPAKILRNAAQKLKVGGNPVIVCLPRQMVNVRMLELPSADSSEVADMIELQVGKLTPYSRDEVYSDFSVTAASEEGYSKAMVGIVQRGALREKYYSFEEAGLNVERVSVSTEGLRNWCRRVFSESNCAVLDVDSFYSDLVMCSRGELTATRSILVGANQLSGNFEDWKEKFAGDVKRALETFSSGSQGAPEKLALTGADVEGLQEMLETETGLTVEAVNPVEQLSGKPKSPDTSDPEYRTLSLTAMIGMALAPGELYFNLVPDTAVLKDKLVGRARSLSAFAILFMILSISLTAYGSLRVGFKMFSLDRIEQQLKKVRPIAQDVERKQEMVRVAVNRQNPEQSAVSVISAVHEATPGELFVTQLSFDRENGQVLIDVLASRSDISRLVENLQKADLFARASERNMRYDSRSEMYRSQVAAELE